MVLTCLQLTKQVQIHGAHIKGSLKPAAAFSVNLRKSVFRIPWSRKFLMACECCI